MRFRIVTAVEMDAAWHIPHSYGFTALVHEPARTCYVYIYKVSWVLISLEQAIAAIANQRTVHKRGRRDGQENKVIVPLR